MAFLGWLAVGFLSAAALHRFIGRPASAQFLDLVLGMVGAFWIGLAACLAFGCNLSTFAPATLPPAALGSVGAVQAYHWLRRRRR